MNDKDFSVLIPIYHKENPLYFEKALQSITEQSLPPRQIVVVEDGPVEKEFEKILERTKRNFEGKLTVVRLKKNMGLGKALQKGLDACVYPYVARMDADDIAMPDRFEKQMNFLDKHPDIDMVGSWIEEFENDPDNVIAIRRVPLTHEEITVFSKKRNPMNHMTVLFRKDSVIKAGGYQHFPGFEDYALWARMLMRNCRLANIPESLVKVRAGREMIQRRKGIRYATLEWHFLKWLWKNGFLTFPEFVRNIVLRFGLRIMPEFLVQKLYSLIREQGK